MNLRRSLAPLALLLAAPLLALAPSAQAGVYDADQSYEAQAGNVPPPVDIVKVRVTHLNTGYRAIVKFTDLTTQKANRYAVRFVDSSMSGRGLAPSPVGNAVDLRVDPKGTVSTKAWNLFSDESIKDSSCKTITAKASYNTDSVTFFVPEACWKAPSDTIDVTAASRHFAPGEYRTGYRAVYDEALKSDYARFDWFLAP